MPREPLVRPTPLPAAWRGSGTVHTRGAGLAVAAASCVLLLLALDRVVRGVAALLQSTETMYGEALIYDHANRLLNGEALYRGLDQAPFTVAAYTPLYYALVAGLQALFGPGFGPGRALSLGAGCVAAVLVGKLAATRTADPRAGVFAALLFLGLGFPGDYPWFAFYKEDILATALSLGTIATLDGGPHPRRALLAGALAGLAFFAKQTHFVAGVVGFIWLWRQSRASAVVLAATALIVAGVPSVWLELSTGAYIANTVGANLNPMREEILAENLETFARYQGVALVLLLLPLMTRAAPWRRWTADPLMAYWLVSLLVLPVALAKVGSNWNYWIDVAAATAVLATRGVWLLALHGGRGRLRGWVASVALVGLVVTPLWLPQPAAELQTVVRQTLQPDTTHAAQFAQVLARVRQAPGVVLGEPLDILTLADREIVFEPYIFSILYGEGRWDPTPMVRQICSGDIGLLVLDHELEGPDWEYQGFRHWPTPMLDALRVAMRLERTQANLFLYVPRAQIPPTCFSG